MSEMDIGMIRRLLPHRYPMLLVDRVLEIDLGKRIVGLKNVTANEPFFQGHFPGVPIMPGVLIVEAMAQCSGILCLSAVEDRERKLFLFGGVEKARFRRPVVPGDQLILTCNLLRQRSNSVKMQCEAHVDGVLVAEAELLSVMTDRPE